jgi:fucose permease
LGIITQECNNNLPPVLFIVFQSRYGISYERLGRLILLNFATQLTVDVIVARYADRIGHRLALVLAEACGAAGLILLAAAPLLPIPAYVSIAAAVMVSAIGGGLLEVLVSPVSDALPADEKQKAANMALLHSFYCWGQLGVVAISTLLLSIIGNERWQLIPALWVILPAVSAVLFAKVPFAPGVAPEKDMGFKKLFNAPLFVVAALLMVCSGASELAVAQWSSLFAEQGLGLTKLWGDLAGPCMFAVLMGLGRTVYGIWGAKMRLLPYLSASSVLCVLAYLMISLSGSPALGLIGCALCGLSVSIMWPGVTSMSAARFPLGGTAMFGMLAMFGDIGYAAGPWLTGIVAEHASGAALDQLQAGLLAAAVFPAIMVLSLRRMEKH